MLFPTGIPSPDVEMLTNRFTKDPYPSLTNYAQTWGQNRSIFSLHCRATPPYSQRLASAHDSQFSSNNGEMCRWGTGLLLQVCSSPQQEKTSHTIVCNTTWVGTQSVQIRIATFRVSRILYLAIRVRFLIYTT